MLHSSSSNPAKTVQHVAPYLAVALLAAALYAVTLGGTFIYDDVAVILKDRRIADPHLWGHYWTDSYNFGVDNLYRPLVSMTYAVQHYLHGDTAWPYHLVNVLLHAIASVLVSVFATKLARRFATSHATTIGVIAGVLFAAHPVHVEAVANIVGRAELMCAIGTLGALCLALDPLTPARVIAIAGLFLLALLSKEQGMLVPLMVGVVFWFGRDDAIGTDDAGLAATRAAPRKGSLGALLFLALMLPLAVYVFLKENVLHLKSGGIENSSTHGSSRFPTASAWIACSCRSPSPGDTSGCSSRR